MDLIKFLQELNEEFAEENDRGLQHIQEQEQQQQESKE
jgi:hypothetical protein